MIDILKVRSKHQIAAVSRLAQEIWQEYYLPIIGQDQVDYMLAKFQSEQAIAGQITSGYEYFVVVHDAEIAGYTAVIPNVSEHSIQLSKIYVRKPLRDRGLGWRMFMFVENLCRMRHIKKIWLTVNKNNRRSIDWYSRRGFINSQSLVQDIGEGFVMDDYRMEKTLE